jgi:hypothetical protein
MGPLTTLLLLPVMAPVWSFRFVIERLREEAEAALHDEGRAFAQLIELSMRRNSGQLTEAEYAEQETQLLDRLSSIREYKDELLNAELDADADVDDAEDAWIDGEPGMDDDTVSAEPLLDVKEC